MLEKLEIDSELEKLSKEVENEIKGQFKIMDEICEKNSITNKAMLNTQNKNQFYLTNNTFYDNI